MNPIRLVVVSGGISEESSTHRLAAGMSAAFHEAVTAADQRADVAVEQIIVSDLAHAVTQAALTGFAPDALATAYEHLARADAVIAVTPTYKASYTGLFKSFWDASPDGILAGVPVLLGATGGSLRHSLVVDTAMRPLFAYMKARVMPTGVYAASQDWAESGLSARIREAAAELAGNLVAPTMPADDAASADVPGQPIRRLEDTRRRAANPFDSVPTMADMLNR